MKFRKTLLIVIVTALLFSCAKENENKIVNGDSYPRVDGSTANMPMMAQIRSDYLGEDLTTSENYVDVTTTDYAWRNLLEGKNDLLLVYEPSSETKKMIEESDVKLKITPIGVDALVFIENENNPIDNLSTKNLQDIYEGKVTNWKEVGGDDKKIEAFQRPLNSGSQTLFLNLLMKDKIPMDAIKSYRPQGMADLIEVVAGYNDDANAIGYSVFYYAKKMYSVPGLKLISVDNVEPNDETIASGKYPFLNEYYLVIREDTPMDSETMKLYNFILSDRGKESIRKAGYIPKNIEKEVEIKKNLKWWQNTIVYEAYPSSFKDTNGDGYGDLKGLTSELDYLKSLGVGAIWLTPIYGSPMGDNGYDVSDYYSINPLYGTMDDMDRLIKEADDRNIKIVMDLVFNHTSKECEWFKESRSSKDNNKSDWYIWRDPLPDGSAPNNWRGIFGGSAWTYDDSRKQYYLHTFADFQPDVNWENKDLRKALYDVANFWVDKGVGGFRVDAVTYIKKPNDFTCDKSDGVDGLMSIHNETANTDGILDFLSEFKKEVNGDKDIFFVGEANGVDSSELDKWVGKDGVFDMIFRFDLVNIQFAAGEYWYNTKDFTIKEMKNIISNEQEKIKDGGWCPIFFENHDQPRSIEHFLKDCNDKKEGAKALATLLMTLKGTPFIYEGEELGMTNVNRMSIDEYNDLSSHNQYKMALENGLSNDEALKCVWEYSRDNARSPMQWNDTLNAGFTSGKPWLSVNDNYKEVNVESETKDETSVLNWYKGLNKLRQEHSAIIDGDYKEIFKDDERIYSYERENENEIITVLVNLSDKEAPFDSMKIRNGELILTNGTYPNDDILKPYEVNIYCHIK